tara:strand:+ start:8806 stop:10005 length:1200 start_codon:yes stop_codon:yes gene_type:complete
MTIKVKKNSNIILRINEVEHNTIRLKSQLFNKKKSDYLRHSALSYWEDPSDTKHFKVLSKTYQEGNEYIKKQVVELLFQYYRKKGFPYGVLTDEQKENRLNRVIKGKSVLLENDELQQNLQGMDLANSFHFHMMSAYYKRGDNSPLDTFNDDERLKDCINRWLELGNIPNPAGMRRILKTRDGTRGVVNFRPTVAKFIYNTYCSEGYKVLDPCSGYGGRLIGCIASNKNIFYHGIDPNGDTAVGNMNIASFFSKQYDMFEERVYRYKYCFDLGCAEEVMTELKENSYDLVFTSPPYFNTEVYNAGKNQSSNMYEKYQEWKEKFLFALVDKSRRLLKSGGKLILNVKNLQYAKIADDLVEYCSRDWELEKTYKMRLANSEFARKNGETYHFEPIFVFKLN